LSIGALSNQLYTMIVAMAVVTTMVMPPSQSGQAFFCLPESEGQLDFPRFGGEVRIFAQGI
jgi:hypothetical protein